MSETTMGRTTSGGAYRWAVEASVRTTYRMDELDSSRAGLVAVAVAADWRRRAARKAIAIVVDDTFMILLSYTSLCSC